MNSKELILAAINHQTPERIPVDLGATPSSGISLVAYQNLIKYLGKNHLKSYVYDVIQEVVQPEMELLDEFHVDVLDIGRHFNTTPSYWHELEAIRGYPALYPAWFTIQQQPDGSNFAISPSSGEAIGIMPQGATFFDQLVFPYADDFPCNYSNLGKDMQRAVWGGFGFTPWDWTFKDDFWTFLREKTIELKNKTDKALLLGIGCNLFEWGSFLRRLDQFLMDLFIEPLKVHALLDALMESHLNTLAKTCEAVGDIVDIIKFGDDLGMINGPFFSSEIYREFFKPRHKILCDYTKTHSSMHTMLHCCGGIYELIPDLIDAGFEILNPIQINAANMEPERLKNEFGKDVVFCCVGCDTSRILNRATPEEVMKHVLSNLEIFGKDGGFVFTTVHNIMPDVPPENIVAMFDAVNEFNGRS
jgi:uroporphyrinogen decarboxylase